MSNIMIQEFLAFLQQNDTAMFATILSTAGPIAYSIPRHLGYLARRIYNSLFYSIDFHFSNESYYDVNKWLNGNLKDFKFMRSFRAVSKKNKDDDEWETADLVTNNPYDVVPAYGNAIYLKKGMPIIFFSRTKEEDKRDIEVPPDVITFTVFWWQRSKLDNLFKNIKRSVISSFKPTVYLFGYHYFNEKNEVSEITYDPKNNIDSVNELFADIHDFLESKEWYVKRGIKYKRGYMLYGPPGTGKSTLVSMIASHFSMNVFIIPTSMLNKGIEALATVPPRSIILIEDIDTAMLKKRDSDSDEADEDEDESEKETSKNKKNFTDKTGLILLGELLNSLDGVASYKDSILFVTTNKPDDLDCALKRPGRIDKQVEVGLLTPQVIKNRFTSFFDIDESLVDNSNCSHRTIAETQNIMISNKHDMIKAAKLLELELL